MTIRLRIAGFLAAFLVAVPAHAASIASYRAVFDLGLGTSARSSGVAALDGRLVLEWRDTCEGYIFAQRIRTEMIMYEGGPIINDYMVSSLESRDGRRFRFSLKHVVNDAEVDLHRGVAEKGAAGEPGVVGFTSPADTELALPKDVIFPSEHNLILARQAIAGERVVSAMVFDGSGAEGLNNTVAFIGRELPAVAAGDDRYAAVAGQRSWPVRLAYFQIGTKQKQSVPVYEVGFRLFESGVPGDLSLEYPEYSIIGRLKTLKILPSPDC